MSSLLLTFLLQFSCMYVYSVSGYRYLWWIYALVVLMVMYFVKCSVYVVIKKTCYLGWKTAIRNPQDNV